MQGALTLTETACTAQYPPRTMCEVWKRFQNVVCAHRVSSQLVSHASGPRASAKCITTHLSYKVMITSVACVQYNLCICMPTVEVFCSTWDGIVYLSIHRALTMAVDAGRFASSCLCSKSNCFLSLCSSCCNNLLVFPSFIQLSTFRICVWHISRAFVCVGPCFPISYIFYDVIFFSVRVYASLHMTFAP